ncbi:unnamed protein product [Rhizoctonia solani]|uniref:DUF6533 domain-containing protein n=1 Tax=Rhizoctonia solani TaxID=456999 RepID=A0A8H3D6S6_9AGAM|nr:unnamed protein product [Rhizoctonia solani]
MDIIGLLAEDLAQMELAKRLTVASLTLLVYDWASNIHLEAVYVWGTPWTYGRFLYHLNRICPLIFLGTSLPGIFFYFNRHPPPLNPLPVWGLVLLFHPSPHPSVRTKFLFCRQVVYLFAYGCSISTDIITGVLVLRCWALYSSRYVGDYGALLHASPNHDVFLRMLSIGLICTTTCTLVIANQIMKQTLFLPQLFRGILTGCTVIPPTSMWMALIPTTIFESTLFILTLWKLGTIKKHYGSTLLSRRLTEELTKSYSGIAYFAARVALIIFACIGGSIKTIQIATNASGIVIAVSSVVCSRISFSLYQLNEEQKCDLTTLDLTSNCESCCRPEFVIPMTSIPSSKSDVHACVKSVCTLNDLRADIIT